MFGERLADHAEGGGLHRGGEVGERRRAPSRGWSAARRCRTRPPAPAAPSARPSELSGPSPSTSRRTSSTAAWIRVVSRSARLGRPVRARSRCRPAAPRAGGRRRRAPGRASRAGRGAGDAAPPRGRAPAGPRVCRSPRVQRGAPASRRRTAARPGAAARASGRHPGPAPVAARPATRKPAVSAEAARAPRQSVRPVLAASPAEHERRHPGGSGREHEHQAERDARGHPGDADRVGRPEGHGSRGGLVELVVGARASRRPSRRRAPRGRAGTPTAGTGWDGLPSGRRCGTTATSRAYARHPGPAAQPDRRPRPAASARPEAAASALLAREEGDVRPTDPSPRRLPPAGQARETRRRLRARRSPPRTATTPSRPRHGGPSHQNTMPANAQATPTRAAAATTAPARRSALRTWCLGPGDPRSRDTPSRPALGTSARVRPGHDRPRLAI